jgi:hypothetical protein
VVELVFLGNISHVGLHETGLAGGEIQHALSTDQYRIPDAKLKN